MLLIDVLRTAFAQIRANLLRSIFTLLGIIVSVAFLVAVVAVIQGMNSYVADNLANASAAVQQRVVDLIGRYCAGTIVVRHVDEGPLHCRAPAAIVAFGRPVVPDVKARMQTSSLEVATSSNVCSLAARRSAHASSP